MSEPVWDHASPALADGRPRRPEIVSLRARAGLPDLATLFLFMRDAELRFETLRMRIEDRTRTAGGVQLATIDVAIRHPGAARVTTTRATTATAARYETWLTDGTTVRTYSGTSKVATVRPIRRPPGGVQSVDLPRRSRVYPVVTGLPRESLPDTFVHPAGFCQNVLATGKVWVATSSRVHDREGIVVECDHPRSVLIGADRPDHHLQVTADVETGIILRLVESVGGEITRDAQVTLLEPDVPLVDALFEMTPPPDARLIY